MMHDRIRSQRDACIDVIDRSANVDDNDKMMYRDLINNAANGTNGLNPEEKLQNVSETVFSLVMLKIIDKCSATTATKMQSMYQVISDCKWALCVIAGILSIALILRPELSTLVLSLSGKS